VIIEENHKRDFLQQYRSNLQFCRTHFAHAGTPGSFTFSNHRATTQNIPCPLTSNTLPQYDLSAPEKSGAPQNSSTPRARRTIPLDNTSALTENAAASALVCPRGTAIRGTAIPSTLRLGSGHASLGTGGLAAAGPLGRGLTGFKPVPLETRAAPDVRPASLSPPAATDQVTSTSLPLSQLCVTIQSHKKYHRLSNNSDSMAKSHNTDCAPLE
jgi:hypothetical protein